MIELTLRGGHQGDIKIIIDEIVLSNLYILAWILIEAREQKIDTFLYIPLYFVYTCSEGYDKPKPSLIAFAIIMKSKHLNILYCRSSNETMCWRRCSNEYWQH